MANEETRRGSRGEYRAIMTALWNAPDFQQLSPQARLVWLALKGNCGPTGIAAVPGLVASLEEWTGYDAAAITRALAQLESDSTPWVRRERNVVSIADSMGHSITHDPSRNVRTPNHRHAAQTHVASLPRLALVRAFVLAHSDWFPRKESEDNGLAWVWEIDPNSMPDTMLDSTADSIPHHGRRKRKTEDGDVASPSGKRLPKATRLRPTSAPSPGAPDPTPLPDQPSSTTPPPPDSPTRAPPEAEAPGGLRESPNGATSGRGGWPARVAQALAARGISVQPGRVGAALKPAIDRWGEARLLDGLACFFDDATPVFDVKPDFVTFDMFVKNPGVWIERATPFDQLPPEDRARLVRAQGAASRTASGAAPR